MELNIKDVQLAGCSPEGLDRAYSLIFQVRSPVAVWVGAVQSFLQSSLPPTLESYGDVSAPLFSFAAKADDPNARTLYSGTAEYKLRTSSSSGGTDNTSSNETQIQFRSNSYEIAVEEALDKNGKRSAVLNTAGEPFQTPLMEIEKRLVIAIEKTFAYGAGIDPSMFARYQNTVNKNSITIAGVPISARAGLVLNIDPKLRKHRTYRDWRVLFELEIRLWGKTYDREILNQGLSYLVPLEAQEEGAVQYVNGEWCRRVSVARQNEKTGEYESSQNPVLLDENGGLLLNLFDPVYVTYRTKKEVDWSIFNLPKSL
jgi:hypothetical protein